MNRKKTIIFIGFFLPLVLIVSIVLLSKLPPIVNELDYIYGLSGKVKYQLFLRFNRDGRLWRASYYLISPDVEVAGIMGNDGLENVVAKLGSPTAKVEWSTHNAFTTVHKILFFPRQNGYISAEFEGDQLVCLTFAGDSPSLPDNLQMWMTKGDVEKIIGSPDGISDDKEIQGSLFLSLILVIYVAFWGALLINIKPEWRGGSRYFLLFIIYCLIFGILFMARAYLCWIITPIKPPTASTGRGAIWPILLLIFPFGFPFAVLATWIHYSSGLEKRSLYLLGTVISILFTAFSISLIQEIIYLRVAMSLPLVYRLLEHMDITPLSLHSLTRPFIYFAFWSILVFLWHLFLYPRKQIGETTS